MAGASSFFRLVVNSKRFNSFQKKNTAAGLHKQALAIQYDIRYKAATRNIYLRTYAGDIKMFYEILWEQVYWLPPSFTRTDAVIVDAGANIGMAGLYFSSRYPGAHIYCIEPGAGNFHLLQQNLAPEIQSGKVHAIQAALYSNDGETGIDDSGWAYNMAVNPLQQQRVPAITMGTFLQRNGLKKIDLLKIDVEGAEVFIFNTDTTWLQSVDTILIEIHSQQLIEDIKSILLHAGFNWYSWNRTPSSDSIFLASRTITADKTGH
jgi:FkbM family methyltransferase